MNFVGSVIRGVCDIGDKPWMQYLQVDRYSKFRVSVIWLNSNLEPMAQGAYFGIEKFIRYINTMTNVSVTFEDQKIDIEEFKKFLNTEKRELSRIKTAADKAIEYLNANLTANIGITIYNQENNNWFVVFDEDY